MSSHNTSGDARAVGVGVIGLGFMGRTHLGAYQAIARQDGCRVVGVCDRDPARAMAGAGGNLPGVGGGLTVPAGAAVHSDPDALLADPGVELVSICTHTDTHVDLAMRAMRAGKNVVVEKPVALRAADVGLLADLADSAGVVCMPAMCMRFWPGWSWLRDRVRDGAYGRVLSATFQRMGSVPAWGGGFYADESRSGGAIVDLHVNDVDFVLWCFGAPSRVLSGGTSRHVTTIYRFPSGPAHVTAEGSWELRPEAGFKMRYTVCFETATAEFDLERAAPLRVHENGQGSRDVPVIAMSAYEGELRHALALVRSGQSRGGGMLREAERVMRVLEAERASVASGEWVAV